MNDSLERNLKNALINLYQSDAAAKAILDKFSDFKKRMRETSAARAAVLADASHSEILALFRKFDSIGAGEFKAGRRGSKTRIEWKYSVQSLGAAAKGVATKLEDVETNELEDEEEEMLEAGSLEIDAGADNLIYHSFQLRPDLQIIFRLPVDLTNKEAERISGFIKQIPFDA